MPRVATSVKPSSRQVARDRQQVRLVVVVDADERGAALRQPLPDRQLRLRERDAEVVDAAHHLAGRLHLGPENRVDAGEPHEREHRALHEHAGDLEVLGQPELARASARPSPCAAIFASGTPVAFDRYGTVRDARGFTSST